MKLEKKKRSNLTDKHVGSRVRMRRLMLHVSQGRLANALGVTFQQVQKYEKGTNRISASRLQQISDFLKVPVLFFFEGAPNSDAKGSVEYPGYVMTFFATSDGLALASAFMQIRKAKLRHSIIDMVEQLAVSRRI
jgi:transcriptional regulator with XRE-family HTH domain